MALQTSPPISLNDIKAEFGATGTHSLTSFYRGGSFVPNIPQNSSVPTSGTISLLDFLGATAYVPLTAFALPSAVIGMTSAIPGTAITNPSTATPSGGTGSYTYLWEWVSGDTETIMGNSPSSQIMVWSRNMTFASPEATSVWRCRVSDGVSTVYVSVQVSMSGPL